jgi:DNA-dependent RNA polymerase auxiliary subunit epsilon
MIFKVYYQETKTQVPVRENTKTIFVEGESIRDIRKKLVDKPYNIEIVIPLEEAVLEYEKLNEDYKVLEL